MKQQSDFWYGLGVNQFLSACKVNLNAETTACLSVLTFRNFRLFRESLCHKVLLSYKNYLFDRFPDTLSAVLIHTILLISNESEQIETIYMKKKVVCLGITHQLQLFLLLFFCARVILYAFL